MIEEKTYIFSESEVKAMVTVIREFAKSKGEDTIGAFMYTGAFHYSSAAELSDKLKDIELTHPGHKHLSRYN